MGDSSRAIKRPFIELRLSIGQFAIAHGWFHLYYLPSMRPSWLDVGVQAAVYVIGERGGVLQSVDPVERPVGDFTFVGEVVSVERLRMVDLEPRHLMPGVPYAKSPDSVFRMMQRMVGAHIRKQDPIEVVTIRRLSYRTSALIGPIEELGLDR